MLSHIGPHSGEGPSGLVTALQLLERHDVEIDEYNVSEELLERVDSSCLLLSDIESLNRDTLVRPQRWYDYIPHIENKNILNFKLRNIFPAVIPFNLIDIRLLDLALQLEEHPDNAIASGYRRLEDLVRERTSLQGESGSKLLSKAFQGDKSILYWDDHNGGEHSGKVSLFTAIFTAYRNRRAHKKFETDPTEALREFLLINELFILESKAVQRPVDELNGVI